MKVFSAEAARYLNEGRFWPLELDSPDPPEDDKEAQYLEWVESVVPDEDERSG